MQVFLVGFAALMVLVHTTQGQKVFLNQCPKVKAVKNFTVEKFAGLWYEQMRYPLYNTTVSCVSTSFTVNSTNNKITVEERQYYNSMGKLPLIGTATFEDNTGVGKITYPLWNNFYLSYVVVDTDYSAFALIFSCLNFFWFNLQYSWFLTRQRSTSIPKDRFDVALNGTSINATFFTPTDQLFCGLRN